MEVDCSSVTSTHTDSDAGYHTCFFFTMNSIPDYPNTVSGKLPEILILGDYCDTITLLLNGTVNSVPTLPGCNSFLPIIFTATENDRDL